MLYLVRGFQARIRCMARWRSITYRERSLMAGNLPSTPIRQKGERTKRKERKSGSRQHTKSESEYLGRVVELGCALCRYLNNGWSPAEAHHPRTGTGAGRRASHFSAIPLCVAHHRHGPEAIHAIGRKAFERLHGITELELLALTKELLK